MHTVRIIFSQHITLSELLIRFTQSVPCKCEKSQTDTNPKFMNGDALIFRNRVKLSALTSPGYR